MRKISFLLIGIAFLLSSCGIHSGLTKNVNNQTTEVVLSKNNFKVVEVVQGESKATYVFGIGGLKKQALISEARADMLSNSNLLGSSKAIINETVEIKNSFFLVARKYKVIVSAYVIEFTE